MCRTRTVNAGNLDQAVIDITFSLPSSSSSKYTFELRNKGSSLLSIKLDMVAAI